MLTGRKAKGSQPSSLNLAENQIAHGVQEVIAHLIDLLYDRLSSLDNTRATTRGPSDENSRLFAYACTCEATNNLHPRPQIEQPNLTYADVLQNNMLWFCLSTWWLILKWRCGVLEVVEFRPLLSEERAQETSNVAPETDGIRRGGGHPSRGLIRGRQANTGATHRNTNPSVQEGRK